MAKDPAFLFYSDNFLSGTMFFTDDQVGKYIRLLCAQHLTGHLSEKHMIFICKTRDQDIWDKFTKDAQGKYFNERLENEILKRKNYSVSRKNNRTKKELLDKKDDKISSSYDKHMGNGNGNINGNDIEVIKEESVREETEIIFNDFENFRRVYPGTKRGYKTEFENFRKKHKDWKLIMPTLYDMLQDQIRSRELIKQSGGFIPEWKNLQTYINQRSWEEEFNIKKSEKNGINKGIGATDRELAELFANKFATRPNP